jgi:putative colanic acid biosynthesis UDP-glucose lipid carrier transferase
MGWGIILGVLLFLGYSTKTSAIFSRRLILTWVTLVPVVLYLWHLTCQAILRRYLRAGHTGVRAVIVGTDTAAQALAEQLRQSPELGIELLGFFTIEEEISVPYLQEQHHLGSLSSLTIVLQEQQIDCVYITPPVTDENLTALMTKLQDLHVAVSVVPNVWMFNLLRAKVHRVGEISMIALWETPLYELQYDLKRLFDIGLAFTSLIILAPLLLSIALLVKLTSPGPILFKQRRYGLNGQEIIIYKFRSMKVMEDGSVVRQAQQNDRRVTAVGKILRRTSLDELPQLINVLQGRMSIVGPRPHAVAHNELYRTQITGYMLRHKVKPGMTGWAQVNGFRGETDTLEKMQQRIKYDLDYINRWSLALDLRIIVQTFVVIFSRQNAY